MPTALDKCPLQWALPIVRMELTLSLPLFNNTLSSLQLNLVQKWLVEQARPALAAFFRSFSKDRVTMNAYLSVKAKAAHGAR